MLEEVNQRFRELYNSLNKDTIEQLADVYAADAIFIDPIHSLNGLGNITDYFKNLYENVVTIHFDYADVSYGPQLFHQDWTMTFVHPKMKKGEPIVVNGSTRVRINSTGLITEHRDYFDVGQMIYQNVPILGSCIQLINRRLSS